MMHILIGSNCCNDSSNDLVDPHALSDTIAFYFGSVRFDGMPSRSLFSVIFRWILDPMITFGCGTLSKCLM